MRPKPEPKRILDGLGEPIFSVLPERVLANLKSTNSENALLWNLFYPISRSTIELQDLISLRVLWGTQSIPETKADFLEPYFWGYGIHGRKLDGLDEALGEVDGQGQQTEVDLFLVGQHNLIAVEAKHIAQPGRCQRYQASRCPEIHRADVVEHVCRYWHEPTSMFSPSLDFGDLPEEGQLEPPPCHRHYQLGRTLLVGQRLAERRGLLFHMWLVLPTSRWRANRRNWLDFTERVTDSKLWRRLRVVSWREVRRLPAPKTS
jgi:hypothetical protein